MKKKDNEQNETDFDNTTLNAFDQRLAILLIENPSSTDSEIADKLGTSRQTINRRKKSKTVQRIIQKTLSIPEDEVRRLTAKAFSRLEKLLDDDNPKIRFAATLSLIKLSNRLVTSEGGIELPSLY